MHTPPVAISENTVAKLWRFEFVVVDFAPKPWHPVGMVRQREAEHRPGAWSGGMVRDGERHE